MNVQPNAFPTALVDPRNPLETAPERVLIAPPGVPLDGVFIEEAPDFSSAPDMCDPAHVAATDNRPYMYPCPVNVPQGTEWDAHHRRPWQEQQWDLSAYYYGQAAFGGSSSRRA